MQRNGYDENTIHDVASVTKSWTSALVGMARDRGKLTDLDASLPKLLPGYFAAGDYADKSEITLRHLLQMRSGTEFSEDALDTGAYGGEELLQSDVAEFGLGFPMAYAPGETWNYSSLDTQILSAVFQQATGESLESFAIANLFPPLGVSQHAWVADGVGTSIGGQQVLVLPELDLIIVTTADLTDLTPISAGEQEEELYSLTTGSIFPALTGVELDN